VGKGRAQSIARAVPLLDAQIGVVVVHGKELVPDRRLIDGLADGNGQATGLLPVA